MLHICNVREKIKQINVTKFKLLTFVISNTYHSLVITYQYWQYVCKNHRKMADQNEQILVISENAAMYHYIKLS